MGVAFLGAGLGALAWVALVPLIVALDRAAASARPIRSALWIGYLFGFVFFLLSVHWIGLLSDVAITVPWLKYPAWVAAAAYLAIFPAVTCGLAVWLARRSRASLALSFPVAWVVVEEWRGSGELGFPWFQAGYTQYGFAPLIQMASLGGVTLVTAWILVVNVLAWRALVPRSAAGPKRSRGLAIAGVALALLLPWLWGLKVLAAAPSAKDRPVVALVQGNIAGEIKWAGHHQREILAQFLELSDRAMHAPTPPRLIVWPETATGSYLRRQVDQAVEVARFTTSRRVPLFAGFADFAFDSSGVGRYYNAAGMFLPDGTMGTVYAKRHLVPFGERMPFQRWFPQLGKIELGQAEWTPGREGVLFPGPGGRFGCLICFESIFPDLSRDDVRRGARWLLNVTNDEWFGRSVAIEQHAAMAIFRAVENHVPLARCANTGLTFLVDANGRVVDRLPIMESGVLIHALPPPGLPTLYTRIGDWPGALALVIALVLLWPARKRASPTPRVDSPARPS
jgi:apolipoprotein N-acyltransferase